ncbi:MAG: tRNA (guanosine(46)-N7)-methyltransferase TrmB [Candidatus Competibacteraceae bacterium]|nr:tRNA (guanosine(46)-N7)-methyltransferase TrmB [Candidatus Competibacteraceae bacterium]
MTDTQHHRAIRSFVRREGRLTPAQERALDNLWSHYGLDYQTEIVDLGDLFGRDAPRVVEIGFGNGETLAIMARDDPQRDFLGIEVHRPGVGRLLALAQAWGLANIRVSREDAVQVLTHQLAPATLDRIQIFFPDPWPKKRHHKRRLIQPPFVELLCSRLKTGGRLHLATDWEPYARWMLEVLEQQPALVNEAGPDRFSPRPDYRPATRFERRGQLLGHGVWDLIYRRA